ncbi:MAG TPA: TetR/AcrR family transcriptional regulator [Pseudonocardiaceae bacterium]
MTAAADHHARRPPASPRTGRPRSSTIDAAILEATLDEFAENGMQGMTIARIAARAGVPRSTVYRRWSSVDELARDALDSVRDPAPRPPGGSVRDDLLFMLEYSRHIVTATRFGQLLPQLAVEARRDPGRSRNYVTERIGPDRAVLAGVMRRGIDERLIRAGTDIDLVLDTLLGLIEHRSLFGLAPVTSAQLAQLVDVFLAGLAPRDDN